MNQKHNRHAGSFPIPKIEGFGLNIYEKPWETKGDKAESSQPSIQKGHDDKGPQSKTVSAQNSHGDKGDKERQRKAASRRVLGDSRDTGRQGEASKIVSAQHPWEAEGGKANVHLRSIENPKPFGYRLTQLRDVNFAAELLPVSPVICLSRDLPKHSSNGAARPSSHCTSIWLALFAWPVEIKKA